MRPKNLENLHLTGSVQVSLRIYLHGQMFMCLVVSACPGGGGMEGEVYAKKREKIKDVGGKKLHIK